MAKLAPATEKKQETTTTSTTRASDCACETNSNFAFQQEKEIGIGREKETETGRERARASRSLFAFVVFVSYLKCAQETQWSERERIDERAPLTPAPTHTSIPTPAPAPHPFKSFTALSRVCIANSAREGVRGVGTAIGQRAQQSVNGNTHAHTHTRRVPHKWLHKY